MRGRLLASWVTMEQVCKIEVETNTFQTIDCFVNTGKSTTLSMLEGVLKPTSGDIIIYGMNATTHKHSIRTITGIW